MTEKELGKALLTLDPSTTDTKLMTQRILDRDRRRMRWLTGLAALFWSLTAAGFVCIVPFYSMMVAPRLRAYQAGRAQLANDWDSWARVGDWASYLILSCIVSFLMAAICTVLLILLSRRATLRQINASLLTISDVLKQLRQAEPGEARIPT